MTAEKFLEKKGLKDNCFTSITNPVFVSDMMIQFAHEIAAKAWDVCISEMGDVEYHLDIHLEKAKRNFLNSIK